MPTGYTSAVQDGEITDFRTFALRCARAFGALIDMRDEPGDAPKLEPNTKHYDERLALSCARKEELLSMTAEELDAAAEVAYQATLTSRKAYEERKEVHRQRYESMLSKVQVWQVPEACKNLRDFMIEQINTSIECDCSPSFIEQPVLLKGHEYLKTELQRADEDIIYYQEKREEEITRTAERNLWIDTLRASLA